MYDDNDDELVHLVMDDDDDELVHLVMDDDEDDLLDDYPDLLPSSPPESATAPRGRVEICQICQESIVIVTKQSMRNPLYSVCLVEGGR